MPPYKMNYATGEPVWAFMDGYPWWPGKVVTLDEVVIDSGEDEPEVRKDEVLVEFFNDNKRFAAMHYRQLRPFLDKRYDHFGTEYDGQYVVDQKEAVAEALRYCVQMKMKKPEKDAKQKDTKQKKRKTKEPEPYDDIASEEAKKSAKKRRKKDEVRDADDEEQKSKKKRKSDKNPPRERSSSADKRKRPKSSPRLGKSQDSLLADDDAIEIPSRPTSSPPAEEPKREMSPAQALDNELRIPRRKSRRGGEPEQEDLEKDPEVAAVRNIKKRSRSKVTEAIDIPAVKEEKRVLEPPKEKVDEEMADADSARKDEVQRDGHKINHDAPASGRRTRDKTRSKEKFVDENGGLDGAEKATAVGEGVEDEVNELPLSGAYRTMSSDQLIKVLEVRDMEIRSYRMQLWRYRLDNMNAMSESELIKTQDALNEKCAPVWDAVKEFLALNRNPKDGADYAEKRDQLEKKAVRGIQRLQRLHFDIRLLPDSEIAAQTIKYARKTKKYSVELTKALRDLVMQWVDMLCIEEVSEDEPFSHSNSDEEVPVERKDRAHEGLENSKAEYEDRGKKSRSDKKSAVQVKKEDKEMDGKKQTKSDQDKKDTDMIDVTEDLDIEIPRKPLPAKDKETRRSKKIEDENDDERESGERRTPTKKKEIKTEDKQMEESKGIETEGKDPENEEKDQEHDDNVEERDHDDAGGKGDKKKLAEENIEEDVGEEKGERGAKQKPAKDRSRGKGKEEIKSEPKVDDMGDETKIKISVKALRARFGESGDKKEEEGKKADAKASNVPGTPKKEGGYKSKSPDPKKNESPSKRREERIGKFTSEVCRETLTNLLRSYKESEDDDKMKSTRKDIAVALEMAIRPRRSDDAHGYYSTARHVGRSLQKAFATNMLADDDKTLEKALTACLSDSKEARRFVDKLLDGGFAS